MGIEQNSNFDPDEEDQTAKGFKHLANISNPEIWKEKQRLREEARRKANENKPVRKIPGPFRKYTDEAKELPRQSNQQYDETLRQIREKIAKEDSDFIKNKTKKDDKISGPFKKYL